MQTQNTNVQTHDTQTCQQNLPCRQYMSWGLFVGKHVYYYFGNYLMFIFFFYNLSFTSFTFKNVFIFIICTILLCFLFCSFALRVHQYWNIESFNIEIEIFNTDWFFQYQDWNLQYFNTKIEIFNIYWLFQSRFGFSI